MLRLLLRNALSCDAESRLFPAELGESPSRSTDEGWGMGRSNGAC